jgi:uncharacterized protein (UPF0264 family)
MKVLISPVTLKEAEIVAEAGTDILDIKNTREGSLGAQFPWIIKEITDTFWSKRIVCSATLGDLPYKPGTAALASYGAANCGVTYIKAGLHGVQSISEAVDMMQAIVQAAHMVNKKITVVASGYADYRRFGGIPYKAIADAARQSGAQVAMLDTFYKDGSTLFDAMSYEEVKDFTRYAHQLGLKVALAGSINTTHVADLLAISPDIIGVRGVVCEGQDRKKEIKKDLLAQFLQRIKTATRISNTNALIA